MVVPIEYIGECTSVRALHVIDMFPLVIMHLAKTFLLYVLF